MEFKEECPILNGKYKVARDSLTGPLPQRIKVTNPVTKVHSSKVQRLLAQAWADIAQHFRESGMSTEANKCETNRLYLVKLAETIEDRQLN